MTTDVQHLIDALDETWRSTIEACQGLSDDDWALATGCPGWTVKDNLSHIVGLERELGGEPIPQIEIATGLAHVVSPVGEHMERAVELRRGVPGNEVLLEMSEFAVQRLAYLRAVPPEAWEGTVRGPMGSEVPAVPFLSIRVFDCWAHEQDIRRALGRPGNLDGSAAKVSLDRTASGLGYIIGKKAEAPETTIVAVHITGPQTNSYYVSVRDGKAEPSDPVENPTVSITVPFAEFMALACGRSDADREAAKIEGDSALGQRIISSMAVTP